MENEKLIPLYEHQTLSNEIISEYDLGLLLGINYKTLNYLRLTAALPYIPLNQRNRVYSIPKVKEWLNNRGTLAVRQPRKPKV